MRVRHVGYSLEEPARSGLESLLSGTGSGLRRGVALASGQGGGMVPEIRYVKSDGVHIAYQMLGDGPIDLVFVSGFTSHAEHQWEEPSVARFLLRLASFSRLIWFDKRGTGLSDQVPANEHFLDLRMEDLIAVLDGVGVERVALLGASEGGPTCILFAATSPERVSHLVLYATWARFLQDVDYPIGVPQESAEPMLEMLSGLWGTGEGLAIVASQADVRHVLASVRVPTLILHRAGDPAAPVAHGRYLAEHIPGATYVELPGVDHPHFIGDADALLDEVQEFLTGSRGEAQPNRALLTVLFTDIVGSTAQAVARGDRTWRDLLESHDAMVRRELDRFRGKEIKTVGDGFLATFDGPARAIQCALAIRDGVQRIGLQIRAGLHTGEVELAGEDIGGLAVHIAARVAALAGPGEVLVSRTVRDLVAGSGMDFEDRGTHTLKGIPDDWKLLAALPPATTFN
jgi:class 3 adenylate cyclase